MITSKHRCFVCIILYFIAIVKFGFTRTLYLEVWKWHFIKDRQCDGLSVLGKMKNNLLYFADEPINKKILYLLFRQRFCELCFSPEEISVDVALKASLSFTF